MGCCQSAALNDTDYRSRSELSSVPDTCYPDKAGYGGVKVLGSFASSAGSTAPGGRTYTRLVIGPDWLFAALFEAHGGSQSDAFGTRVDTAARYCAEQCYAEFQRVAEGAGPPTASGDRNDNMRNVLSAAMKALDRRFLSDDAVPAHDRLVSGCTGVLLHVALGENPVATAASLGPSAAVVGQRRGGLASATSAPIVLCGGTASSHNALDAFLANLDAEQRLQAAQATKRGTAAATARKKGRGRKAGSPKDLLVGPTGGEPEPEYSSDLSAAQALGFGGAKRLQLVSAAGLPCSAAAMDALSEARVGLEVQTACHSLGPADDCVVLLSGGAAAGIAPGDVALLMHRMGRPLGTVRGPVVQLDNLGVAGPPPPAAGAVAGSLAPAATIAPFNAARLLVQHAADNAASRRPNGPNAVPPSGVMAFALEWPRSSDDSEAAAAASGASVSAVRAAAAAAAGSGRRAQYHWQLLRLYYKFPHKRHSAIIERWHDVFDRVVGDAKRVGKLKETVAWVRMGAAVKVSTAGNVQCLSARERDGPQLPAAGSRPIRSTLPGGQPSGVPSSPPLRGAPSGRQQSSRTPNQYGSPGLAPSPASAIGASTLSPASAAGHTSARHRSPIGAMHSARQRSPSPSPPPTGGPPGSARCASAREMSSTERAGGDGAARASPVVGTAPAPGGAPPPPARRGTSCVAATPPQQVVGRVGLLEAEGIVLRESPGRKLSWEGETAAAAVVVEGGPGSLSEGGSAAAGNLAAARVHAPVATSGSTPASPPPPALPQRVEDAADRSGSGGAGAATPPVTAQAVVAHTPAAGTSSASAQRAGQTLSAAADASPAASKVDASPNPPAFPSPIASASPTLPASSGVAPEVSRPRVPSLSAGGATLAALGAAAAASGPLTSRSRANGNVGTATPRSSIPTLQLRPGPPTSDGGSAAPHATPRLSMPGGIPPVQRTPSSSRAGATFTPPARTSATWGGAPVPSLSPSTTPPILTTAPGCTRSGSSRLPRPSNPATPPAAASPSGSSTFRSRSTANDAVGAGAAPSRVGSASARGPAVSRPPRLDVGAVAANAAAAATPGSEADLFSPDAEQLAAWAQEAVAVIGVPAKQHQQQQPATPPSQQQQLDQQQSLNSSRGKVAGSLSGSFKVSNSSSGGGGRPGGVAGSSGGAKPSQGSRIPFSPRADFNPNGNGASGTPPHGSAGKATRTSSNAGSLDNTPPQRTLSARARP